MKTQLPRSLSVIAVLVISNSTAYDRDAGPGQPILRHCGPFNTLFVTITLILSPLYSYPTDIIRSLTILRSATYVFSIFVGVSGGFLCRFSLA